MGESYARLEGALRALFDRSLVPYLSGDASSEDLASRFILAMRDGTTRNKKGQDVLPDQYALLMNVDQVDPLVTAAPELEDELAAGLLESIQASAFVLMREPQLMLATDPMLSKTEINVVVWHSSNPLEFTQTISHKQKTQPGAIPRGAYLMIDGERYFPLDRPVINIGRRLDNQLILENTHVSRSHAQLRVRKGRFVLHDLGSSSGTRVNGRIVSHQTLRAGDVVSLANVRLLYGEEGTGPLGDPEDFAPSFPPRPQGDQTTETFDWDNKDK